MDTQSRFLLDRELFEDLKSYLEEKKRGLRDALLLSIARPLHAPSLSAPEDKSDTLLSALTEFNQEWKSLRPEALKFIDERGVVERLSNILWNYVEILEGMCPELFEQLKAVPVDQWDQDLYDRLDSTKVHLWLKLKEIEEFIHALDKSLEKFVLASLNARSFSPYKKMKVLLSHVLDPELEKRIRRGEFYLHEKFIEFSHNFVFLKKLESRIETEFYKFQRYAVLDSLEKERRRYFGRLWRLLQIWKAASKEKKTLLESAEYTLKHICPSGKTSVVLRDYLARLKMRVFDLAREYRTAKDIAAQAVICSWRSEVQTLMDTLIRYRDFLIATDRTSRTLMGFRLGSEPRKTRELSILLSEAERVDAWLKELFEAQELGDRPDPHQELMKFSKVDKLLKDMGQPLTSHSLMKRKMAELVSELIKAGELVSSLPEVSDLMLDTLLKALKTDAKHGTLISTPGFSSLFEVHSGLSYPDKSAGHLKRMKVYKKVTQHLSHWLLEHELSRHNQDIEHEIHDIQETLQEFYHILDTGHFTLFQITEFRKELLEERIFFAAFFQFLREHNSDGRHIRAEFSFVDQYFNAIDEKLLNLRTTLSEKK